jgi:hypothetical protein
LCVADRSTRRRSSTSGSSDKQCPTPGSAGEEDAIGSRCVVNKKLHSVRHEHLLCVDVHLRVLQARAERAAPKLRPSDQWKRICVAISSFTELPDSAGTADRSTFSNTLLENRSSPVSCTAGMKNRVRMIPWYALTRAGSETSYGSTTRNI